MQDRLERLSAMEGVAADAWVWIEQHIEALEARDIDEERKAYWRERWRKTQRQFVEIGAQARRDRKA